MFEKSHPDIFIDKIQEMVIQELEEEYGDYFKTGAYGRLVVLEQIYVRTGYGFIFIIDEWDCVFRIAKEWYEGYLFNEKHIFNLHAVAELMSSVDIQNYWTE